MNSLSSFRQYSIASGIEASICSEPQETHSRATQQNSIGGALLLPSWSILQPRLILSDHFYRCICQSLESSSNTCTELHDLAATASLAYKQPRLDKLPLVLTIVQYLRISQDVSSNQCGVSHSQICNHSKFRTIGEDITTETVGMQYDIVSCAASHSRIILNNMSCYKGSAPSLIRYDS